MEHIINRIPVSTRWLNHCSHTQSHHPSRTKSVPFVIEAPTNPLISPRELCITPVQCSSNIVASEDTCAGGTF